jgi:hypothetical protein
VEIGRVQVQALGGGLDAEDDRREVSPVDVLPLDQETVAVR